MLCFKSKANLIKRINELESLTNRWAKAWGESVEREGKLIEEKHALIEENYPNWKSPNSGLFLFLLRRDKKWLLLN